MSQTITVHRIEDWETAVFAEYGNVELVSHPWEGDMRHTYAFVRGVEVGHYTEWDDGDAVGTVERN